MIQKLINNALHNIWTSISGSIAGIAQISEGINTNDTSKIITGIGLVLLGLFATENK
jgi:hypothetical protein